MCGSTSEILSICASADGGVVIVVNSTSSVAVSSDYGFNWRDESALPCENVATLGASASGRYLSASCGAAGYSHLYLSNDQGKSWNDVAGWDSDMPVSQSVLSNNGKVYYVLSDGFLLVSLDQGLTWVNITPIAPFEDHNVAASLLSVACDDTGGKVFVTTALLAISGFRSSDFGQTWEVIKSPDTQPRSCVSDAITVSSDGCYVLVHLSQCDYFYYIFSEVSVSDDCSVVPYIMRSASDVVTMSRNGQHLLVHDDEMLAGQTPILISHDFGATWKAVPDSEGHWVQLTIDNAGTSIIAVDDEGFLHYF